MRVVVTGVGAVSALGLSAEETWQKLVAGQSGVTVGKTFGTLDYPVKIAAEVSGFEIGNFISRRKRAGWPALANSR